MSTAFGCVANTIRLRSGRYFDFNDPQPDQFTLGDIAGALSKICRFGGQIERFYCPTLDQRVLTADLRWVPAGDLAAGTELLAFDEIPHQLGMANVPRRRFRHGAVVRNIPVKREVYQLELEDGSSVRSSAEHPWLVATKASRNQKWLTTEKISEDVNTGKNRYMHRFFSPWSSAEGWDAGWLAGIYDGEGYLSFEDRRGTQLGVSQIPGEVLDRISDGLASMGFLNLRYSQTGNLGSGVITLQMNGGWRECARLLGTIRPYRLLARFVGGLRDSKFDKQLDGKGSPTKIVAARRCGEGWVAGIETTTRTYFCEGFGAHNSVAEHCWHCAQRAHDDGLPLDTQIACLMHDAAEAFCGDMVKPLKIMMPGYAEVESRVEAVIAEKFLIDFDRESVSVRKIDHEMLIAERRRLFSPDKVTWAGENEVRKLCPEFRLWSPDDAEMAFVRMARLVGLSPIEG